MREDQRTRFLKRARTLRPRLSHENNLTGEEVMSKTKLIKFREIKNTEVDQSSREEKKITVNKDLMHLYEQLVESAVNYNVEKSPWIFQPDSMLKVCWDLIGMLLIIYQGIFVPFRICFDSQATGPMAIFELLQDFFFLLDIIISANTGYYEKGDLILLRKKILINYLKLWLWLDMATSFPYSLTVNAADYFNIDIHSTTTTNAPQILRLLKFMRFMRVLRLLRVIKLKNILLKFEEILMSDSFNLFVSFSKLLFIVLFIAHWGACFWFYIGLNEFTEKGDSWIIHANILNSDLMDQYICSIYFYITTMTTVGYGDIVPITSNERLYAMFSMLLACGIFAYVIGSIGTFLSSRYDDEMIFKQKIMYVDQFLKNKSLQKGVRTKVRRFLEHMLENKREQKIDEGEVLDLLNKNLKEEIVIHLNGLLLKNGTFSTINKFDEFCLLLTSVMKEETINPGDVIFHKGDLSLRVYFINRGVVSIHDPETKIVFKELDSKYNSGSFGEIGFFAGIKRCASAECLTFVKITYIFLNQFKEMAYCLKKLANNKFKEFEKDLNTLRLELREKKYDKLKCQCYLCDSINHIAPDCPKLRNVNEVYKLKFKDRKHKTEIEIKKLFEQMINNTKKTDTSVGSVSEPSFTKNTEQTFLSFEQGDDEIPMSRESISLMDTSHINVDNMIQKSNENSIIEEDDESQSLHLSQFSNKKSNSNSISKKSKSDSNNSNNSNNSNSMISNNSKTSKKSNISENSDSSYDVKMKDKIEILPKFKSALFRSDKSNIVENYSEEENTSRSGAEILKLKDNVL